MSALAGYVICFLGSAAVAINFNVPSRAIVTCGLLGDVAWFGQVYMFGSGMSLLASNFAAAFFVALLSELFARVQRLPVTCLAVPGVIPLVPGFSAYNAMYGYVTDQFDKANVALLNAVLIAGAISAALATAGSVVNLLPGQKPWRNPQSPVDDTILPVSDSGSVLLDALTPDAPDARHAVDATPPRDSG
jgi:uncharacterized membrane protein YjjB (DUF3815 family)